MRYAFVARHGTRYPTRGLCRVLGVSVSGFHDYLHRQSARIDDADSVLRIELRAIHAASNRNYGRHRLVRALRARNHPVGHKRVTRLMPVWLRAGQIDEWMAADPDSAMAMLLASEAPAIQAYRVSRKVNMPRNNDEDLLTQVA